MGAAARTPAIPRPVIRAIPYENREQRAGGREQKEGERIVRSERYYGTVSRAFSLGTDIDESKCQAKYQDGVLELVLAKKAGGRARQITVN